MEWVASFCYYLAFIIVGLATGVIGATVGFQNSHQGDNAGPGVFFALVSGAVIGSSVSVVASMLVSAKGALVASLCAGIALAVFFNDKTNPRLKQYSFYG